MRNNNQSVVVAGVKPWRWCWPWRWRKARATVFPPLLSNMGIVVKFRGLGQIDRAKGEAQRAREEIAGYFRLRYSYGGPMEVGIALAHAAYDQGYTGEYSAMLTGCSTGKSTKVRPGVLDAYLETARG